MISISRDAFEDMVDKAIERIPKTYLDRLKNVAIIVEDEPSLEQRQRLNLLPGQTLLGLYEGVPLSQRQGTVKLLPDKITIFQRPLEFASYDTNDLFDRVSRTVWHEVAHYFGLDHIRINELEQKEKD